MQELGLGAELNDRWYDDGLDPGLRLLAYDTLFSLQRRPHYLFCVGSILWQIFTNLSGASNPINSDIMRVSGLQAAVITLQHYIIHTKG